MAFLNHWVGNARGSSPSNSEMINPDFCSASLLFPPAEPSLLAGYNALQVEKSAHDPHCEKITTTSKRFVFNARAIDARRAKAKGEVINNPSRVETVSFIWKSSLAASRELSGSSPKLSCASPLVNIRNRTNPLLPKYSTGNMWRFGLAACDLADSYRMGLQEITTLVRRGITSVNQEYLNSIQGENGLQGLSNLLLKHKELESKYSAKPDEHYFGSWLHLGFNEVGFGWGKPVWVGRFEGRDF